MQPWAAGTILILLTGCTSTRTAPLNIVVSQVDNEAEGLPHATRFCAQYDRVASFKTKVGDSFQFDCVKRRP